MLTLSNVAAGSLRPATSGAVTSSYNAATGVWSASCALDDRNILSFPTRRSSDLNFNANFTVATSVSDGVNPAITGIKAFTGSTGNDAPRTPNTAAAGT